MDNEVDHVLNGILSQEGVTGAMFIDKNGLCIAAAGDANGTSAGLIAMIANVEKARLPLTLPGDQRDIILTQEGDLTVAVFKKNST